MGMGEVVPLWGVDPALGPHQPRCAAVQLEAPATHFPAVNNNNNNKIIIIIIIIIIYIVGRK